jgi:hypothetical protein
VLKVPKLKVFQVRVPGKVPVPTRTMSRTSTRIVSTKSTLST